MLRIASVLLLLVVGCGGDKDPTTTTFGDDDDDDGEDTADTSTPAPQPKLTSEVRFRAYVAWDSTLGQVVNPLVDGQEYLSVYMVDLYEAGWSDADVTSYCQVYVELGGTPLAAGVAQEGFLWGVDVPAGLDGKAAASDCLENGFDAEQFADGDPIAEWAVHDWQLRFGGEPTVDLIDWLTPDTVTADFDILHYAAGGWTTESAGYETEPDNNYWYAYAMDDEHNVDFENRLTTDIMTNGTGEPVTAYFIFDQRVYWTLEPTATTP